jgi:glycine cleavage system H protein
MSVILGLLMLAVLLIVGFFVKKRSPEGKEAQVFVRRYLHPGHTWVRETQDGDVLVGVDDFAQSVLGPVDRIELPRMLRKVEQGAVAWRLCHGTRVLPMLSPVTGRVLEKNEMVIINPGLINSSPFGDGWLLRIRPSRLGEQVHNLLAGKAGHQWVDTARAELGRFFSGTPALMYQDGGVLMEGLTDRCSDDEWSRLVDKFFMTEVETTK